MGKYAIFLELADRRVVLVGGGAVATRKAQSLLQAGGRLVVVAEHIGEALENLCRSFGAEMIKSKYSKSYLAEAVLVIAATNDAKLNRRIYKDCQELEVLCNVVDCPELCDFFVPAVVKRGSLQIAIGTEGSYPAYAGHVRKKLEGMFTERHGEFVAELEAIRERVLERVGDGGSRKSILGALVDDESFEYFASNGAAEWRSRAEKLIEEAEAGQN
ncbi:MAG: bifunctional precorrin-2 dehydrogenase/sirohydrochlorin ferrochelatase [Sedimentisphaerales bacterium]|nr:bifunctional precorrin-2 dehydrogenase/sirohydrochlorin ferrochelatase [Sedimentisphaerales bacterium]